MMEPLTTNEIVTAALSGIALLVSLASAVLAWRANRLAAEANGLAHGANRLANEANDLAGDANTIAERNDARAARDGEVENRTAALVYTARQTRSTQVSVFLGSLRGPIALKNYAGANNIEKRRNAKRQALNRPVRLPRGEKDDTDVLHALQRHPDVRTVQLGADGWTITLHFSDDDVDKGPR